MNAAAKEIPEMEFRLGSKLSMKWQEPNIKMKYVVLIDFEFGKADSWNFFNDLPPVTI